MPSAPLSQQQQMHAWQEDQIRRTTRALGFDPLALPVDDRRNDVIVKSLIRTRCAKNHPVKMRATLFNAAWDRMMASIPPGLQFVDP